MNVLASFSFRPVQRWRLGPLSVSPHGVGTALGYLAGVMLMARAAERRGIPKAEVHNAATWGAVGAIIGARGFYVLAHLGDFRSVADVLAVWRGGLTMFGGFAIGLLAGYIYMRRHGLPVPQMLDAAAPGFVAGVMIGRIGDFLIADHLGGRTGLVVGYRIPSGAELAPGFGPPTYVPGAVVHNTAVYDFAGLVVLAGVLALIARRRPAPGTLFATFAMWYGVQRFLIDFTRNRDLIDSNFFGLSGSQWAGLAFAAGGAWAIGRLRRPSASVPEDRAEVPVGFAGAPPSVPQTAETEVVPPADEVVPPADEVVPPADEVVPPADEVVPPADEVVPPASFAEPVGVPTSPPEPPDQLPPRDAPAATFAQPSAEEMSETPAGPEAAVLAQPSAPSGDPASAEAEDTSEHADPQTRSAEPGEGDR